MKIVKKLYLNSAIILAIIVILFLTSGYILQQINSENKKLVLLHEQFRVVNKLSNAITTSINNLNRIIYNNDVDIIAKELSLQEDMMADFERFKAAAEKYHLTNDYNFAIENENKIIKIRNELSRCLYLKRTGEEEEAKLLLRFISQNYLAQFLSFADDVIYHKKLDIDKQKQALKLLKERLLFLFIGVFLILLTVIAITNLLIGRSIAKPITQLTEFTKQLSERNNLSLRSNIRTKDEVGILSTSVDQLIDNLEKSIAKTKKTNLELQKMVYVASHDLQEPIMTITTCANLLNEKNENKFDKEDLSYIRFITENTNRMQNLVAALASYTKLNIAEHKIMTKVDCNVIVTKAMDNLKTSIEESEAKIEFENLPNINGNEVLLIQLFQNIISNAIEYRSKERSPIIKITVKQLAVRSEISIKDNGIGMEEKFYERIFEIFQRLHGRDEHTGIGLAICKKIVEAHKGRIWVKSELNAGSVFIFTLANAN